MNALPTDFLDAHRRHWSDAEHLFANNRLANADQLYAFCAEAGLKQLMLKLGMPFDNCRDWPTEPKDRVHADGVWSRTRPTAVVIQQAPAIL